MAIDIQGIALRLASRFAGHPLAEKYGLRKPAEKLAYSSTRKGFELIKKASTKKNRSSATPSMQFDLSLTDEQQMIRDSVRGYAETTLRSAAAEADETAVIPENLMKSSLELGLNYLSIPESLGGAGQPSAMTSVLIAEDLAWGDFSLAYPVLSSLSAVNAISQWGTSEQQADYLPRFLEETPVRAAIAVTEPGLMSSADTLRSRASANKNGFSVKGTKTLVPFAGNCDLYLVAAELKGRNRLFIVNGNAPGITSEPAPSMGLRGAGTVTVKFDSVQVPHNALLGGDQDFSYQSFVNAGNLMWCAMATGCVQAALDYVIPYANERQAFGEPISHRQSVAFMISEMKTSLDGMRMLTWRAASRMEHNLPFHKETYLARIFCTEQAMKAGTDAVQLLGGHGFTKEHPAERWYRDLRSLSATEGNLHL